MKIEQVIVPEVENVALVLWLGNVHGRIVLRLLEFPDFVYIELPENLRPSKSAKWERKHVEKIFETIDRDFPPENWDFRYRKKYHGYSEKKYPFLTLYSTNPNVFGDLLEKISNFFVKELIKKNDQLTKKEASKIIDMKCYLKTFSLMQKFGALTKINPGDWISLRRGREVETSEMQWSHIKMFDVQLGDFEKVPVPSADLFPILNVLCLDFEVNSHRKGKFPDPWEPPDEIYLASVVRGELGLGKREGFLLTCKKVPFTEILNKEGDKPSPVIIAPNEILMLRKLEELFSTLDPDVIVTYNGDSFDWPYWEARYASDKQKLGHFGRLSVKEPVFRRNNWASSAHKAKEQQLLVVPGVISVDLFTIIRRDYFFPLYNLSFISNEILGDKGAKDELSAEEQFRIYREGTPEEWGKLLHYSLRDSWAPLDIMEKLSTMNNLFAMASIIGINIDDIYSRGQQYRLENKIFQELLTKGIVINSSGKRNFKKYKGALVQEPLITLLRNVACIDFSSLYPTIMIHYNISHDTFVGTNIRKPPKGLTWDDLHIIEIKEDVIHYFVKAHIKIGTLAKLLREFLDSRKQKKNQMKTETDPVLKANLDAEQLALKIIANSGYGFLGASDGKMPLPEGAESVTSLGRMLITMVVDELKKLDAIIVYGDSVVKDTPILVRCSLSGKIEIKTIETLGKEWKDYSAFKPWVNKEKQQDDNVDYEVWTDKGWAKIKRVIRHFTDKKIYEVLTQKGYVRVTEDHSLLDENAKEITPNNLKIGKKLLHSYPIQGSNIDQNIAYYFDNQLEASKKYYELTSQGYSIKIDTVYSGIITLKIGNGTNEVRKIREIGRCDDFVYDLETENGHFQAGVGELIVHNTDSVFFTFKEWQEVDGPEEIPRMMKETERIAKNISDFLNRPPIEIVLDHFYADYLSLKKKCDIKNEVYFDPKTKTWKMKTSYKGNLMVRRESSLFAKKTYQPITITAIGRTDWGEKDALKVREARCQNILWDGDIPEILVEERIPSSKIYTEKEIVVKRSKTLKNGKIKEWEEVEVHLIEKPMEKVNVKKITLTEVDDEIKRSESTVELLKYVDDLSEASTYTRIMCKNNHYTQEFESGKKIGGCLAMLSRSTPIDEMAKITQAGREPNEYKKTSQPVRRFLEREEREGRPIKVGERFRWWMTRPSKEAIALSKHKDKSKRVNILRGDYWRRALEPGDKIDTMYYINSLELPIKRLFKATFQNDTYFGIVVSRIKQKEIVLDELLTRPWPEKGIWTKKKTSFVRVL